MKRTILTTGIALLTLTSVSARMPKRTTPMNYPKAPTAEVTDRYFDFTVDDPYRPLENDTAAATRTWVETENALTRAYLDATPCRESLKERLTQLYNYRREGLPWLGNDGLFYISSNNGLQNQSVIYRMASPGAQREVFLDPNTLSDNGTVALKGLFMSPDGSKTAYTVSRNGSDWEEIYVMDTRSRQLLPDHLTWAKFTEASWDNDGNGFFYSAYDRPGEGGELSNANENHRIYYHRLGTTQDRDELVFEDKAHPLHFHSAIVPDGNRNLLIVSDGGEGTGNGLRLRRLDAAGSQWRAMEPTQDFDNAIIGAVGDSIFILTTMNAPRGCIMVADADNPGRDNWKMVVPEAGGVLKSASFAGNRLVLVYEQDAANHVEFVDLTGRKIGDMKLPGYGSVSISSSRKRPDDLFYSFTSYTTPGTIYQFDIPSGNSRLYYRPEINGVNPDDYMTEQVFYTSKDGTKVPMFITYKKGLKRDGQNPTLLYGYGGFNISLLPGFSPARMLWLENGGVYAVANLRGGAEYGEEWHQAGTKMNKLNVFNDFIAAGEWLVDNKYCTPDNLVIEGGSNGGLLVGAVTNMKPDLFAVAIPRVGVMDMMRYHLFTIGWNWAADYGRSDDSPEMARYLYNYSPMHNIKNDGTNYPAILVTTADHDDRVVPAHSFKYAATLQQANTGNAPKLIRIESNAGHSAGKPVSKTIDEYADIYAFIFRNLGLNCK